LNRRAVFPQLLTAVPGPLRGPMNGPDEHGRAGPAAEIANEAGGPKPFNRALWTYPAGSDTHTDSPKQIFFRQLSVQLLLVRRLIGEPVLWHSGGYSRK